MTWTHEPCVSRDECYHSRAGKIGGRVLSGREGKAYGGRIQGRRAVESGQLARIRTFESCSKGGYVGGKKGAEKMHELYPEMGRTAGRISARKMSHLRPTWPEVRFYGLVFGDPITADGFSAQQSDGHGIYDGAWREKKIIAELDGGGHHAFCDRHEKDARKDIARKLERNTVLRETDENILFLKALAILAGESA